VHDHDRKLQFRLSNASLELERVSEPQAVDTAGWAFENQRHARIEALGRVFVLEQYQRQPRGQTGKPVQDPLGLHSMVPKLIEVHKPVGSENNLASPGILVNFEILFQAINEKRTLASSI
jgi:hypothetical protein